MANSSWKCKNKKKCKKDPYLLRFASKYKLCAEFTWNFFFFFFLISNKDLLISKKETPKYIGSIQGCTYQIQKLHKSSKSKIEEKCWFLRTENQSNKVLKNRNLRSSIERSLSSKHRLFLSFQIHHIKQWGTTIHISPLRWQPNQPCQQARSSTTNIGITQQTPNKPKTISHNSRATRQWRNRWSTVSLLHLHI